MRLYLRSLAALLSGATLLLLGNGLLNTLVPLAGEVRGFPTLQLGLLSSGYFVGFFIGIWLVIPVIRRVGHIRTFMLVTAMAAVAALLHSLSTNPWFWMVLRVAYGIALVSIYAVIESWLNEAVPAERRSNIFAIYTMISLGSVAAAQQLLRLDNPEAFTLFVVTAVLLCLALMPVSMTRLRQPDNLSMPTFNLKTVIRAAPLALTASGFSGLVSGAFWGLMPLFGSMTGMTAVSIGLLMSSAIVGGALGQLPIGYYSDKHDRRKVLAVVMAIGAIASLALIPLGESVALLVLVFIWGAMTFSVYPISVAYMVDRLAPEDILSGSSAVLMAFGIGAAIGPTFAGALMGWLGRNALPGFFAVTLVVMLVILLNSVRTRERAPDVDEHGHYTPMLRSSLQGLAMMPDAPQEEVTDEEEEAAEAQDETSEEQDEVYTGFSDEPEEHKGEANGPREKDD